MPLAIARSGTRAGKGNHLAAKTLATHRADLVISCDGLTSFKSNPEGIACKKEKWSFKGDSW